MRFHAYKCTTRRTNSRSQWKDLSNMCSPTPHIVALSRPTEFERNALQMQARVGANRAPPARDRPSRVAKEQWNKSTKRVASVIGTRHALVCWLGADHVRTLHF